MRLIAAAAPGGNPDVLARMLAAKLADAFGRPFVVENLPGAGGVVAAEQVARAAPDGHTLMLGDSGALAINVALNPRLTYHPLKDFTLITALAAVPTVLVVNPSLPATSLNDFVREAKAKQLAYGSAGNGSVHHLTMAVFLARSGVEMLHVPYKGGSALVAAVLAGEVQSGWSGIPNVAREHPRRQAARAVPSAPRSARPRCPTCRPRPSSGFAGFDIATVIGLQAPAGLSREIAARLQSAVAKALRERDLAERMANLGMELRENGTEHYARFVREDLERYAAAVKAAGVKQE